MLSISLRALGVMSPMRMWLTVLGLVGSFIVVGVILTYYAADLDEDRVAMGSASEDDPFLIGAAEEVTTENSNAGESEVAGAVPPEDDQAQEPPPEPVVAANPPAQRSPRVATRRPPSTTISRTGTGSRNPTAATRAEPASGLGPRERAEPTGAERSADEPAGEPEGSAPPDPGEPTLDAPTNDQPEDRDLAMSMYVSQVRFVVRRYYAPRAQSCFDRATRNNPTLSGTVVVGLTIGTDGNITSTSVARNSTGDSSLGACLANQARAWRLPVPPEAPLTLQLPFSR